MDDKTELLTFLVRNYESHLSGIHDKLNEITEKLGEVDAYVSFIKDKAHEQDVKIHEIKKQLNKIQAERQADSTLKTYFIELFQSWHFWALMLFLYLAIDFQHLRQIISNICQHIQIDL